MATHHGIGTLRYDWSRRPDGTAESTVWFVIFLLPIIPLRREHVRVHPVAPEQVGFLQTVFAMIGHGSGWKTNIEILGPAPQSLWRILRTYVKAYIVIPLVTFIGPVSLLAAGIGFAHKLGQLPNPEVLNKVLPVFVSIIMIWTVCLIARIMDHCAGRLHIDPNITPIEKKRWSYEPPEELFVTPEAVPARSLFHLFIGYVAAGLCALFAVLTLFFVFTGDFKAGCGGFVVVAVFGRIAKEWLRKGAGRPAKGNAVKSTLTANRVEVADADQARTSTIQRPLDFPR